MRSTVYIAAPYAPTATNPARRSAEIERHVARALWLGELAIREGLSPIVPHVSIAAGLYGNDEDPAARARGRECTTALLQLVARSGTGRLWVLLTDAGDESEGVRAEALAWRRAAASPARPSRRGTWSSYRTVLEARGLAEQWRELAAVPA